MRSTVPCLYPQVHGVQTHIAGSAAANDCARGSGTAGARLPLPTSVPKATVSAESWSRDSISDLRAVTRRLAADLRSNPRISSERVRTTAIRYESPGHTEYSYDGVPFLSASTLGGIAPLPQAYGGKPYGDDVWNEIRRIATQYPDSFNLRSNEPTVRQRGERGFPDGYIGQREVIITPELVVRIDADGNDVK